MLDIHAFSRLVSRAPQHLKLRTYFLPNPKQMSANARQDVIHFYRYQANILASLFA